MNTDDQFYLEQIKNGDSSAYSFLVNRYKDMVYNIAIKILRNPDEAQDMAQECFIKAYQQLHQFEGKSKFSTWLYTIVYRASVTKLKENKIDTVDIGDNINEIIDDKTNQFDQLQARQIKQQVNVAIKKLPQVEAVLITLYYINDVPIKEIQEITGLSGANIKIKLFRARKKLERELKVLLAEELKT